MTLITIHLLNWFYSFSLNRLSLICFCNWKKKKTCLKNTGQPDPTRPETWLTRLKMACFDLRPIWPANPIDPTRPTCFAMSTYIHGDTTLIATLFFFFLESFNPWCLLLMIALYHQTKTPINIWCRWGLNPKSLKINAI